MIRIRGADVELFGFSIVFFFFLVPPPLFLRIICSRNRNTLHVSCSSAGQNGHPLLVVEQVSLKLYFFFPSAHCPADRELFLLHIAC